MTNGTIRSSLAKASCALRAGPSFRSKVTSISEYPAGPSSAESVNHRSSAAVVTRHGSDEVTDILPARASASSDRKLSPPLIISAGRVVSSSLHAADPAIRVRQRRNENSLFITNIANTVLINAANLLLLRSGDDFTAKIKPYAIPYGFYSGQKRYSFFRFLIRSRCSRTRLRKSSRRYCRLACHPSQRV